MDKRFFSIGEVSKLKNVTIKALRYYHNIGLLIPAHINPDNGYRFYTINQFLYLDIIKVCRQSNVSIKEIKDLFAKADTNSLKLYLEQKNEDIYKEIKKLKHLNKQIETLKKAIYLSENELMKTGFNMQTFEERYFFSSPTQGGEINEIKSFDKLDETLDAFSSNTFQYGLVHSQYYDNWIISDVFRLITTEDYLLLKDTPNVSVLPKGEYLTVNCTKNTELETFQSVKTYLEKNSLSCDKIYLFYLMIDVFNQYNHFSQYQISLKSTS